MIVENKADTESSIHFAAVSDIVLYLIELTSSKMHHSALRRQHSRKKATSPFLTLPLPPTLKSMVLFRGFSDTLLILILILIPIVILILMLTMVTTYYLLIIEIMHHIVVVLGVINL